MSEAGVTEPPREVGFLESPCVTADSAASLDDGIVDTAKYVNTSYTPLNEAPLCLNCLQRDSDGVYTTNSWDEGMIFALRIPTLFHLLTHT